MDQGWDLQQPDSGRDCVTKNSEQLSLGSGSSSLVARRTSLGEADLMEQTEGLLGGAYLLSDCEGNCCDHGDEHGRKNSEGK
jgi:hypothetical protein